MRPRFSIRLLLVAFAVLAAACYVLFARPTVLAERFVAAVMGRDFRAAQSLLRNRDDRSLDDILGGGTRRGNQATSKVVLVYAEVLPREWTDLWAFQRRVILRVALQDDSNGRHTDWTEDARLITRPWGLDFVQAAYSP
jgi:hypothetical protein